jgi:aspartyl-tRNA(Asn)/glutamyl-tRNA(Gln) amidotransferase subunit A
MILETAAALRRKKISSAELIEQCLERIASLNPRLNAFVTVTAELARRRARAMDDELARGIDRGPLHGIPVAHKDLFFTEGVRTTAGSKIFADFVPDHDATAVARLKQAGAVTIGKTGMHELAYGITSNNPHYGAVRNPCDDQRIPGGSSGGSAAAVAAGMALFATGSDTGGSIRIPSSFCGIAGLKPTYGRVSKHGTFPLGFSLDHVGPMARTVRDAAIVLNALAGHDPLDPTTSRRGVPNFVPDEPANFAGLRIGRPVNFYFDRLDPEVAAAVERAFRIAERGGARLVPVTVPDMEAVNAVARLILLAEVPAALEPHLAKRDQFGADVLALLDQGRLLPATDYVQAQRLRLKFLGEFTELFRQVDAIFTPTTPTTAPRIGETRMMVGDVEDDVRLATTRLVRGINALGLPALSAPCGASGSGLPIGLQIVGAPFREEMILRAGAAIEDSMTERSNPS